MTRYFLFVSLFFLSALSATERNIDTSDQNVKTVFYGCHSYVCFNGEFYLHDPDCRCDAEWAAITKDKNGKYTGDVTYITRKPVSHYD